MPVLSPSLTAFRGGKRVENCSPGAAFASRLHGAHPRVSNQQEPSNHRLLLEESTQSPRQETLLLEGDEFHVSRDGICRTYYTLKTGPQNENSESISLEEHYDLHHARKTFIVRRDYALETHDNSMLQDLVVLGAPLSRFELQEIDQGVLGSAGTGATTWESSIAMSLFFSSNPTLLYGNVVELGSGVGLAGLLSQTTHPAALVNMNSLTLTDASDEVLEQCRQNLNQAESSSMPIRIKSLNWYDFIDNNTMAEGERYDTILASDCAYRYSDVVALASTMTALLQKKKTSRIHIFGPYNRGALQELVEHFKNDCSLNVKVDWIEMSRIRLKPSNNDIGYTYRSFHHGECAVASRNTAKFLHITTWFKDSVSRSNGARGDKISLSDID